MRTIIISFLLILALIQGSYAGEVNGKVLSELLCSVKKKYNSEYEYKSLEIEKWKPAVKIKYYDNSSITISRCSYSLIEKDYTCDEYIVDHTETTKTVDGKLYKKFYYFDGQLDVQIFPDSSFVENNGRGDIAYGVCK